MGTVLNNRTVYEMRSYFETHGSRGPYVRSNREAATMWLKELNQGSKCVDDMQPLHLSQDMCNEDPDQRPTAAIVVSEILDFQGEAPYCGHCCDSENGTLRPTDNGLTERGHFLEHNEAEDLFQSLSVMERTPRPYSTLVKTSSDKKDALLIPGDVTEPTSNPSSTPVQTPSDKEDGLPIPRDIPPDHNRNSIEVKSNWQPPTVEDYEGTVTMFYPNSPLDSDSGVERDEDKDEAGLKTSKQIVPDNLRFSCEWPGCRESSNQNLMLTFDGGEELEQHYRSQHLVHEFGRSQTVATRESAAPVARLPTQADANVCLAFVLKNLPPPPATSEGIPVQLRPRADSVQKKSSAKSEKQTASPTASENSGRGIRFSMLPDSKRPETTIPFREVKDVRSNYNFITPEPVEEPILLTNSGSKGENEKRRARAGLRIPKSSMVPSYVLAASNRFTRQEIETLIPPARFSALVPPPLFVYGSLMFPSILRARAEQFTGAGGIYSEKYQRRLKTDASDWSRINFSLQHAAEQMTPARLEGYDRFKPYGVTNAAIARGKIGSSVPGFILFGLSEEALKCLDQFFSSEELEELYGDHNFERAGGRPGFIRRRVEVVISVKGGDIMTVDAVTYDSVSNRYELDGDWDINKFVGSKTFTKLSGAGQGSFWMEEETRLASTMGITLVLSGDMLCSAVLRKDKDKLLELLDNGHDVNALCTYHGSALAAAAFTGREDFVELLIRQGANVNATGGEYYTPLIAATTQGHDECARALIKAGADVLAQGGKYISAIYQAVDFSDAHLAKMFLEKGAWLTKDYRELLDLSAERGNGIIMRMIEDYKVRQLCFKLRISKANKGSGQGSKA
jgi:hypothetical protein